MLKFIKCPSCVKTIDTIKVNSNFFLTSWMNLEFCLQSKETLAQHLRNTALVF